MAIVVDNLKKLIDELAYNGNASGPLLAAAKTELDALDAAVDANTLGTPFTATTAELSDIADAINTTDKYVGKMVFDTTASQPFFADGADANSTWSDAVGLNPVTPS